MARIPRVGKEINTSDYWRERAAAYSAGIEGAYHAHRLFVIERLLQDVDLDGRFCSDFGCGEGVILERLAASGGRVLGLDPVEEMVAESRRRLAGAGLTGEVRRGGGATRSARSRTPRSACSWRSTSSPTSRTMRRPASTRRPHGS